MCFPLIKFRQLLAHHLDLDHSSGMTSSGEFEMHGLNGDLSSYF